MKPLIRILHLEDDPNDVEFVQAKLEEAGLTCRVTAVQARDEFEKALRQDGYDIILADFRLPMYDGMSALRLAQELRPDVPFVFVSGTMGEEAAIEALKQGATDYVLKQKMLRLASAVERALHEAEERRERKRAEEALRKLSSALEQSPVSIVITDTAGNIEYVNPKFTDVSGYSRAEVLGKNPRILQSGEHPKECYKILWETITSGKAWHEELYNRKKSGDLYWESATISPIFDTTGSITHFVAVKEDITEHKRLETQYRQAQKMEAVGQLAGGVAHDFNNMLGVIIGTTELLMDRVDPAQPLYANLQEIRKAAEHSADLTRQLLAFARKQTVAPRVLDLNKIVEGILKMLRRLIGEDIALSWLPGAELWPVKLDPSQIDQILANLCVNASDAIADVGKIVIETGNVTLDEAYCDDHPGFVPASMCC